MTIDPELESTLGDFRQDLNSTHSNLPAKSVKRCNASELSARIAELAECSQLQARAGLNVTTDSIIDLTIASGDFTMIGVGTWRIKDSVSRSVGKPSPQEVTLNPQQKYRTSFSSSKILNEIMNEPLGSRAIKLASFKEPNPNHQFSWVSGIVESEIHIIERAVINNKSNTQDLYEIMKCRGLMSEGLARNFIMNLKVALHQMLLEHRQVMISGFGTFHLKEHAGRVYKPPSLDKEMFIPPHRRVKFIAGTDFKRRLNQPLD